MSASSGIGVSPELTAAFASAVESKETRFLKVKIQNESLIPDETIPTGSNEFIQDLPKLQEILQDDVPAYVLARTDAADNAWLFISYVPDTAKELEEIRAIERESSSAYEGSGVRQSIVGSRVGMKWTDEVGDALKELPTNAGRAVIISIDPTNEVFVLKDTKDVSLDEFPGVLPPSEPAYAFYSWTQGDAAPHVIFTYTCPSGSPVKHRMLYSSGVASFVHDVKAQLGVVAVKRLEASDPTELDLDWLRSELTPAGTGTQTPVDDSKKPFAKPRGPGRRK
ncbi:Twinfilin-1 [Ceratobasidium sp. 414]|nr:Twinfilin-1 [Ceratobasidium sp. 414]